MTRYSEREGVREKEMKGESTDDSMVKTTVEGGEKTQYTRKKYTKKPRKTSRQVASVVFRVSVGFRVLTCYFGVSSADLQSG